MSDPLASLFIWRKIRREAFREVAIRVDLNVYVIHRWMWGEIGNFDCTFRTLNPDDSS